MNLILFIIPFCFYFLAELPVPKMAKQACTVQQLSDTIKWSPVYKLNVNDFKALTYNYKDSKYDTWPMHQLLSGIHLNRKKGKLLFDAFALFIRSRSWMKAPDEAVLKHEQGHLISRKFMPANWNRLWAR